MAATGFGPQDAGSHAVGRALPGRIMFQFGEILCLALALVLVTYLVSQWRRIRGTPILRPFIGAILLLFVSWVATVVEGVFLEGVSFSNLILIYQQSVGLAGESSPGSRIFNWIEHVTTAAAGVWLLVGVLRLRRMETPPTP